MLSTLYFDIHVHIVLYIYIILTAEEKVHHDAYQMCQIKEPTSMDEALRSTHGQIKHIDIHFHYIREAIQDRTITLQCCPTEDMIADIITKHYLKDDLKHFAKQWELDLHNMNILYITNHVIHVLRTF